MHVPRLGLTKTELDGAVDRVTGPYLV